MNVTAQKTAFRDIRWCFSVPQELVDLHLNTVHYRASGTGQIQNPQPVLSLKRLCWTFKNVIIHFAETFSLITKKKKKYCKTNSNFQIAIHVRVCVYMHVCRRMCLHLPVCMQHITLGYQRNTWLTVSFSFNISVFPVSHPRLQLCTSF